MNIEIKSATIELDDHAGVEYSVTITRLPGGDWSLTRVTIDSRIGILTGWDFQPSAERLIYNVVYETDMMFREDGASPKREFDWIDEVTKNLLLRNGIRTMAMLADMSDAQLLDLTSLGPVRVGKLRAGITKWQAQCTQQRRRPHQADAPPCARLEASQSLPVTDFEPSAVTGSDAERGSAGQR